MNEDAALELAQRHVTQKGLEWKGLLKKEVSREWYFFGRRLYSFVVQTDKGKVFIGVSEAESRVTHFGDPV